MSSFDARKKDYPHKFRSKQEQWADVHNHQTAPIKISTPPLPEHYTDVTKHMPRGRKACQCPQCRPSNYR